MNQVKLITASALFSLLAAGSAAASLLDFTDDTTLLGGSIGGINYTVASNGTITRNNGYDGGTAGVCQSNGGPLKCDNDGLGVWPGAENDEIVNDETITVTFTNTDVLVSALHFLDMFQGNPHESAALSLHKDGAEVASYSATANGMPGGYSVWAAPAAIAIDQIIFSAAITDGDDGDNDYALAAIEVQAVPVPAAAWLFGSGLLTLAGLRRRNAS